MSQDSLEQLVRAEKGFINVSTRDFQLKGICYQSRVKRRSPRRARHGKMLGIMRPEMRNLFWICWLYEWFSGALAFPLDSSGLSGNEIQVSSWDPRLQYVLSSLAIIAMFSAFLGCMCCRREGRAKGFQDTGDNKQEEFKDASTAGSETIIERGLELEISRALPPSNPVQFEPLTVERFVPEVKGKPMPPSPLLFNDNQPQDDDDDPLPSRKWFSPNLHVPRERLKYLQEIGRGWFGKVVEGTQDLDHQEPTTRGVVVRILTEEASTSERAWFLGEALPYLKLRHPNILELFGACLETDPYLLLFESCPTGDLKAFLRSNRASEALSRENLPLRLGLDILNALEHMHLHGFAHTDLSARNCLVAPDLSAKLGDYGTGVEKYPGDYYVVGDRALPIRWSAPESLVCTDTTIETRAITTEANVWSFGIVLWEISTWGERPYNALSDEQVIEMIFQTKHHDNLPLDHLKNESTMFLKAIEACWKFEPKERISLEGIAQLLRGKNAPVDFEQRWEILKPNTREPMRSLSLRELDTTTDLEFWPNAMQEKPFSTPQPNFKLGPAGIVGNPLLSESDSVQQGSGSETEEESWRGRVERGAYTEKVKQKSKSVTDLMVLVHIDSDSEAEWSLGPQTVEKPTKKRLPASGSVGDLRDSAFVDEFDEALRKLRNPSKVWPESREKPNNDTEAIPPVNYRDQYASECTSTPKNEANNPQGSFVDVELWKNALEFELERKIPGFDLDSMEFEKYIGLPSAPVSDLLETSVSTTNTPQSRADELSVDNDDLSNGQRLMADCEDEDRKHLSTPDDERSSDSGFRDKESCEEEENPVPSFFPLSYNLQTPGLSSAEEEQLKVLLELDTILAAEDCGSLEESPCEEFLSPSRIHIEFVDNLVDERTENILQPPATAEVVKDPEETSERTLDAEESNVDTVIEVKEPENDIDDEDSSTMSLRSDNSYVSFNLDEEFVTAIRNELREKLPHAQMAVVEAQEPRDEYEPSVIAQDTHAKAWDEDEESQERPSGAVDITIRYNIFGTPLSPILEERESTVTSESLGDASVASKLSESFDDILVVDTNTNRVMLVDGLTDRHEDGDVTDEESTDCGSNGLVHRLEQVQGRIGAPLPSPEEESKWQAQFPIPLQLQDDLMSTSFSTEHDWDSQDEEDEGGGDDEPQDDDENSSSSGEFVWKRYSDIADEERAREYEAQCQSEAKIEEEGEEDEDEEEEFTPSAWDASLAPHRSALRSPEKTPKAGDQKKNVWFKKQRYHCVYEYPKEMPTADCPDQTTSAWEPTTYSDWEEMMDGPKIDIYPLEYDESNHDDEEFFVSSGNRPFQFQVGDGKYVSQFFPGATMTEAQDEGTKVESNSQPQLGELRHTRDRLKLNLPMKGGPSGSSGVEGDRSELESQVDTSEDSRLEKKESTESSKEDESSIISVIRSPMESEQENLSKDLKSLSTNGDSDAEISELESSTVLKSQCRPLVFRGDEIATDLMGNPTTEEKKSPILRPGETVSTDESTVKPSKIENESSDENVGESTKNPSQ